MKITDICVTGSELYFLPVQMRLPLKFGSEVMTALTCARVKITVRRSDGATACGWGETPLSVGWSWPSPVSYFEREEAMKTFCGELNAAWSAFSGTGHPMEIGYAFLEERLEALRAGFNAGRTEPLPHLAALICNSAFDLALHDAYGEVNRVATYATYNAKFMNRDLASYFDDPEFADRYPEDYFVKDAPAELPVWHLVGGRDLLTDAERTGKEPDDGIPVTLTEWIRRDGLKCLKIKLGGVDAEWDLKRLVDVGRIAEEYGADWLSPDFNCMVKDPAYVTGVLDRLMREAPATYGKILYVEQPFPYDLEANRIDVHAVSARKPLFMDESAHDWRFVKLGRSLGWTGVALKVCKTQTGALLSMAWAKHHGMTLMVQDLTNPMLAIVPHVLLAAHAGTIMGVECNAAQFYPAASDAEARLFPRLYRRTNGVVAFRELGKTGFGYRVAEIDRKLS